MQTLDFTVTGMTCQHCVASVTEEVTELAGVQEVDVDLATVDGEPVRAQAGDFYGGWITSDVVGPFKGEPGTRGW